MNFIFQFSTCRQTFHTLPSAVNFFRFRKKQKNSDSYNTKQRPAINTETCHQHFPTTKSFSLLCQCHQNSRDMKRAILNLLYVKKIRSTVSSHNTTSDCLQIWHNNKAAAQTLLELCVFILRSIESYTSSIVDRIRQHE